MMLAGTFEASDGGPTVLLYLIVAAFSIAAAVSVLVGLRWHDRRQLDRRRHRRAQAEKPWLELISRDSKRLEQLAAQVERETRILGEIRHELTGAAADSRPHLKIVKS